MFYVRSVKTIRITDQSLIKRLGIIMLIGTIYLAVWSFMRDRPTKVTVKDSVGLKYDTCSTTEWNFISMASKQTFQIALFLWFRSIYLSIHLSIYIYFVFLSSINNSSLRSVSIHSSSQSFDRFQRDQTNHLGHF